MDKKPFLTLASGSSLGLISAIYSTVHHLEVKSQGHSTAACNINQSISCDSAALSKYSEWFGIPVSIWGMGFFLTILFGLWRSKKTSHSNDPVFFLLSIIGVATSLALGYLSLFELKSLCLACTVTYLATLIIMVGALYLPKKKFWTPSFLRQFLPNNWVILAPLALTLGVFLILSSVTSSQNKPTPTNSGEQAKLEKQRPPLLSEQVQNIPIARSPYSGLGEDFRLGPEKAPIQLVEFSDFQCPACKNMHQILKAIMAEFPQKILFIYRNYPLDPACNPSMARPMHPYACKAAVLARCAGTVDRFWNFHDLVFQQQSEISTQNLEKWANTTGLNSEQIKTCLNAKHILEKIKDDISLGQKLGVQGTPAIYINGRRFLGGSVEDLRQAIQNTLKDP